jgi:hypothetical protein
VSPDRELTATHDPAGNPFLGCAEASKANYRATGNKRYFPTEWRQTQVVNARELLEWTIPELRRCVFPTFRKPPERRVIDRFSVGRIFLGIMTSVARRSRISFSLLSLCVLLRSRIATAKDAKDSRKGRPWSPLPNSKE